MENLLLNVIIHRYCRGALVAGGEVGHGEIQCTYFWQLFEKSPKIKFLIFLDGKNSKFNFEAF